MLYLIEPTLTVLCNRDPGSPATLQQARTHARVDLAGLGWSPLSQHGDPQIILQLALIHGVACSRGIVVDGALVAALDRGQALRRDYRQGAQTRVRSPAHQHAVDKWLGISPSVARERRPVDHRIEAQRADDLRQPAAQASKLLSGDPSPALLQHWITLGGPEPG